MAWIRQGTCNQCGECCANAGSPYEKKTGPCPHYQSEAKTCELHNTTGTYWATGCNQWPSKPEHITPFPSCSFTFDWADDGG